MQQSIVTRVLTTLFGVVVVLGGCVSLAYAFGIVLPVPADEVVQQSLRDQFPYADYGLDATTTTFRYDLIKRPTVQGVAMPKMTIWLTATDRTGRTVDGPLMLALAEPATYAYIDSFVPREALLADPSLLSKHWTDNMVLRIQRYVEHHAQP